MADEDSFFGSLLNRLGVGSSQPNEDARPPIYWPNQLSGATAYDEAMRQARGLQAGLTNADPIEMAMGLLGPRAGARGQRSGVPPPEFIGRAPESPSRKGFRDDTGAWFLEGDKPVYGNASRQGLDSLFGADYAKRFDAFRRHDIKDADGNAHSYWVKPDIKPEQAQALENLLRFKREFSPTKASPREWDRQHRLNGEAFGYAPSDIDAWINYGRRK